MALPNLDGSGFRVQVLKCIKVESGGEELCLGLCYIEHGNIWSHLGYVTELCL